MAGVLRAEADSVGREHPLCPCTRCVFVLMSEKCAPAAPAGMRTLHVVVRPPITRHAAQAAHWGSQGTVLDIKSSV